VCELASLDALPAVYALPLPGIKLESDGLPDYNKLIFLKGLSQRGLSSARSGRPKPTPNARSDLMIARDEKVSQIPPHRGAVRILAIFHDIGLWIMAAAVWCRAICTPRGGKNRVRNVPILAPRGKFWIAKAAPSSRTILRLRLCYCAILPANLQRRRAPHRPGLHLDAKRSQRSHPHLASMPQLPPFLERRHHARLSWSFARVTPQRTSRVGYDCGPPAALFRATVFMAPSYGYVGEAARKCSNQPRWESTIPGDVVGKSGVELAIQPNSDGKNGSRRASW